METKLRRVLNYFLFLFIFLHGQEVEAQYKILSTGVDNIDSLFSRLPLDANVEGDDLLKIKEAINQSEGKTQVKIFTNIGTYYLGSEIIDSSRLYFQKGFEIANKSKTEYFKTMCLMGLARIHAVFAEYNEGIAKLNQALNYAVKSDSAELISNIYRIYGNIYWGMEIYDLAFENYNMSLEVAKKINLSQNIAAAYNNIGNIYSSTKDYENAQKYLRLALETAKKYDHKWVIAVSTNNIGSILTTLGAYDSALSYYRISKITSHELGGRIHEGIVAFNIGETYLLLDSFELAKKYLTQSYNIAIETNDNIGLANSLLKLGELEVKTENLSAAKDYLDLALSVTNELGSVDLKKQVYNIRLEYFKKINNPDSIIENLEMLIAIKDTLARIENLEFITRLEYKYKEKVASQEISLLQKDKKINRLLIFTTSTASILILLILGIYLMHARRRNKKLNSINSLIAEQKELLKEKNSELIISQDKLEKMVYGKDRFITIMSHDLKNPVGAVRGFLELILSNYEDLDDKKKIKFLREVFKSVENISLLIDNILYWIKAQNKGVISQAELFNAYDGISQNIALYNVMANWKKIKIINDTHSDHLIFSDRNIFDTIFRNLLSNSLKFTAEGGEIRIRSIQNDLYTTIELEDNGKGMSESQIAEIFETDSNYSTEGTSNEKGTGLGIGLINEFVSIVGAKFSINSKLGEGTTFSLSFPSSEK